MSPQANIGLVLVIFGVAVLFPGLAYGWFSVLMTAALLIVVGVMLMRFWPDQNRRTIDKAYLRAADLITARLPRAQRETIPGGGHIVNIDSSDAFNTAAVRFLREIAAD